MLKNNIFKITNEILLMDTQYKRMYIVTSEGIMGRWNRSLVFCMQLMLNSYQFKLDCYKMCYINLMVITKKKLVDTYKVKRKELGHTTKKVFK